MMRPGGRLLLLVILVLLPVSCDQVPTSPSGGNAPHRVPRLDLAGILPDDWEHVGAYYLDTNGDNSEEWVILYRFDLPVDRVNHGIPIGAFVYLPDHNKPPNIIAHKLQLPGDDYLCTCTCTLVVDDVLSGLEGHELVIRDSCDEQITRLTIFHWDPDIGEYRAKGHFSSDRIKIGRDKITLEEQLPGRAQLAELVTCYPREKKTYYQNDTMSSLVQCGEGELTFWNGEPKDACCSPYPEKVVLAFYHDFRDDMATRYFTDTGWKNSGECAAGQCGCISARSEISRVHVLELHTQEEPSGPSQAIVDVTVRCETLSGVLQESYPIRWHLIHKDDRWLMDRQ